MTCAKENNHLRVLASLHDFYISHSVPKFHSYWKSKTMQHELPSPYFRAYSTNAATSLPDGIYIAPSHTLAGQAWEGTVFVKDQGPYCGGAFKFIIDLPLSWRLNNSVGTANQFQGLEMRFTSKLFHPLIAAESGVVDINWRRLLGDSELAVGALLKDICSIKNPAAATLAQNDEAAFSNQVSLSISSSLSSITSDEGLRISPWSDKLEALYKDMTAPVRCP